MIAYYEDSVEIEREVDIIIDKKRRYINKLVTFDIETTSVRGEAPYAFMYHWQACVDGRCVFGRTWVEFMSLLNRLSVAWNVSRETWCVIYVHNLSYEFQFMKTFFEWEDVFQTKERTILRARTITGFEFRCSYFLTNQSLELFTENMHVEHRKVKGEVLDEEEGMEFDYEKYRTPFTELTWQEKSYCYNDVMGLYEALEEQLKINDDNLATVPMTSTGYVRRDVRNAVKSGKYMRNLKAILPNYEQYRMLKYAFRGGDTHANYTVAGRVLEDVEAWDITSSYPYVIMARKYPMSKYVKGESSQITRYLEQDMSVIMTVRMQDVKIKDIWDMPYISYSKCHTVKTAKCDNGRILTAKEITITITEVDLRIMRDCYEIANIDVANVWVAEKGWLPPAIRECVLDYFRRKCEVSMELKRLKKAGLESSLEYLLNKKNYMKSKNKLNGIYGMIATDPVRNAYSFDGLNSTKLEVDPEKSLNESNSKWSTFLAYQWGVYVTAYARERLWEIRNLNKSNTLYNDTDSVYWPKGFGKLIEEYNKKVWEEIRTSPIPPVVEVDGIKFAMGLVELDGEYKQFITWGSKRYATVKKDGSISVTVSGLSKTAGKEQLEKDSFLSFKPGWTVERSGNMTAYYNDEPTHEIILPSGEKILSGSNVALFPSSYTLNLTGEYNDLIGYVKSVI